MNTYHIGDRFLALFSNVSSSTCFALSQAIFSSKSDSAKDEYTSYNQNLFELVLDSFEESLH